MPLPKELFVTTVKIAIPANAEPHVLQTQAQNLASSALNLKKALSDLTEALSVEKPDNSNALAALMDALAAPQKDQKVYDMAVSRARLTYEEINEERDVIERKIHEAVLNGMTALHESDCVTDMPELPEQPAPEPEA